MKWIVAIIVAMLLQLAPAFAQTRIQLSWNPTTDNVGVTGYNIYRNGVKVGTSATTTYIDTGLTPGTSYNYKVTAFDAAGNESGQSTQIAVTTLPSPTPQPPVGGGFPDASTTGIPAGTTLTPYTGPCNITVNGTIIDSKAIDCTASKLYILAQNVQIKNSKILGQTLSDEGTSNSFTITDTEVDGRGAETCIGGVNYTATRVNVYNCRRSMYCWDNVTIQDSYIHGNYTDATGTAHQSGVRFSTNCTFRHNSITCDAPDVPPDGGCSAGITGYGDFAAPNNVTIDNNIILRTNTGGYCTYGGDIAGKPFPNATNIRYTNNIWQRKTNGTYMCGSYGPITGFNSAGAGNVWTNNKWDDGVNVPPAN